jgi:hypothetical protein
MSKGQLFWGYIDIWDKVHVKRYRTDRAIANAERSVMTKGIFDPFYAKDLVEAKMKIMERYADEILKH